MLTNHFHALELHPGQKVDFLVDLDINGSVTNARTK